jgi:SAM-dependent methyltransferase
MRCGKCGDVFLFDFGGEGAGQTADYGKDYFLAEYKSQYGKTYIEDKENVAKLGRRRMRIIEHLMRSNSPEAKFNQTKLSKVNGKLLDAGCALGFFLEIARKKGWETKGVEISPFASAWGRKNLSLDIVTGSFLDVEMEPESFDVVTFFFAAEHFKEIEKVIEKTYNILNKNGHIALALPHRGGITYRLDRAKYLSAHPRDHYFDTTVRNLNKFLKMYGFKKEKICITGIHPERFFQKIGLKKSCKVLNMVYTFFAKTFNLGDTFEYYGVKV